MCSYIVHQEDEKNEKKKKNLNHDRIVTWDNGFNKITENSSFLYSLRFLCFVLFKMLYKTITNILNIGIKHKSWNNMLLRHSKLTWGKEKKRNLTVITLHRWHFHSFFFFFFFSRYCIRQHFLTVICRKTIWLISHTHN